jgi:hypothetical protein
LTIEFPDRPEAWYDVDRDTIAFPVRIDGQPMSCVVTAADVTLRFTGRSPSTPRETRAVYEEFKETIRQIAEASIRAQGVSRKYQEFAITLTTTNRS